MKRTLKESIGAFRMMAADEYALRAWIVAKNEEAEQYLPNREPFYKRLWALLNRDI